MPSFWAEALLPLALNLAIPAAYVALAWFVYRRWGHLPVAVLWIGAAGIGGYLLYRRTCSQPLTCDEGGTSRLFISGNPYYFTHYVPLFTAMCLIGFGAATFVVVRRHRSGSARPLWPGTLTLGTAAAIVAWALVTIAFEVL